MVSKGEFLTCNPAHFQELTASASHFGALGNKVVQGCAILLWFAASCPKWNGIHMNLICHDNLEFGHFRHVPGAGGHSAHMDVPRSLLSINQTSQSKADHLPFKAQNSALIL